MNPEPANAVAGPSTQRSSTSNLFLPPPPPLKTQSTHLSSTQDLLGRFHLLPAYDKYVRPFAAPTETGLDLLGPVPATPGATGVVDKGKGKEMEGGSLTPVAQDGGDGDDDDGGKSDKKQRNNYKHLIKGIPGKHSMKKDEYLTTMMLVPPKQRIQIAPFDTRTQRDAFTVSLEGLKGWNPTALVLESAQAREDRKKRKEAKRLLKLQAQAPSVTQPQPIPTPTASATSPPFNRPPQNPISNGSTVPRPGSAAAKNALPPVQTATPRVSTPLRSATTVTVTPTSAHAYQTTFEDKRGMKRERDELPVPVQPPPNGVGAQHVNGVGNGHGHVAVNSPKAVVNAKAGTAGIRPRPLKKQRMDMQGQARDVTVTQQPTPQGV
ncbi:hypothetical protein C0991_010614 [Blastosporella zonata]|nr:hypothetical protein C0991_010614 [Blastosporella zonata]